MSDRELSSTKNSIVAKQTNRQIVCIRLWWKNLYMQIFNYVYLFALQIINVGFSAQPFSVRPARDIHWMYFTQLPFFLFSIHFLCCAWWTNVQRLNFIHINHLFSLLITQSFMNMKQVRLNVSYKLDENQVDDTNWYAFDIWDP